MYVNPSVRNHVYIYSEFVKITDGNGTGLLYHPGCVTYSVEVLAHVTFGLSNNIFIQAYAERPATTIMIKFAILKKGLEPGMIVKNSLSAVIRLLLERLSLTFTANGKRQTFAVCLQLSVQ